jgi:hypothetical protein
MYRVTVVALLVSNFGRQCPREPLPPAVTISTAAQSKEYRSTKES